MQQVLRGQLALGQIQNFARAGNKGNQFLVQHLSEGGLGRRATLGRPLIAGSRKSWLRYQ